LVGWVALKKVRLRELYLRAKDSKKLVGVMGMTFEVVVSKEGQVTIPVALRKKFKIETGTRLEVVE